MRIARRILFVIFGGLVIIKGWLALRDTKFQLTSILAVIEYAALFGSPQLVWLYKIRSLSNATQAWLAAITAGLFFGAYALFGFLPGQSAPTWGSGAHFEVPIALIVEWAIASLFLALYKRAGKGNQE